MPQKSRRVKCSKLLINFQELKSELNFKINLGALFRMKKLETTVHQREEKLNKLWYICQSNTIKTTQKMLTVLT